MEVKLIVARGEDAGDELTITGPKFFIGRAENCQFRPLSELVSRQHCVIIVEEAYVAVRDFGSKNGTRVNDQKVRGEQELKNGDRLKVGDLEFEVRLDASIGGPEKPEIRDAKAPVSRGGSAYSDDDLDLDQWLSETDTQKFDPARPEAAGAEATGDEGTQPPERRNKGQKKQEPGEIVGVWKKGHQKPTSVNPPSAAADALKEFFKNRG